MLAARNAGPDAPGARHDAIGFEDTVLVDHTRKGDMQAFGTLVAKYQDRVFNAVYRVCGQREDAEELTQEAFLKALEKISQFRGQSGFYTWLFRIAVNLVMSSRRRAARVRFRSLADPEDAPPVQAAAIELASHRGGRSPQGEAMLAETQRRVVMALEELDDEMRLVLVLRDVEDMDYSQIADVLSVPAGTVKSRLHRARSAMKDKLADLLDE